MEESSKLRQLAIDDFNDSALFGERARRILNQVLERSPKLLTIVWEAPEELGVASLPASKSVSKILLYEAYHVLWGEDDSDDESIDE